MAAGVPHLRGLQQHHEKEQRTLRHDRGGGAEAQKAEEERLKVRAGGAFSEAENVPPVSFARIIAPSVRAHMELLILVISNCDVADF